MSIIRCRSSLELCATAILDSTDASQAAAPTTVDPTAALSCMRGPVELATRLRLTETPGVGPVAVRQLLTAFGLLQDVFAQSYVTLTKVLPGRQACAVPAEPDDTLVTLIEHTVAWVSEPGSAIFTLADRGCPLRLLELPDPPILLYTKGDASLLRATAMDIVGVHSATVAGIDNTRTFSQALSTTNMIVVLDLALSIDATAHENALAGPGGTIAVVRTGLDIVYPARNRVLAHHITGIGVIIFRYPFGMGVCAENFPHHNRPIFGLARGLLVVEATM